MPENPFSPSQVTESVAHPSDPFSTTSLHGTARTGQIITLALGKGVLIIALIFGVMMMDGERESASLELLLAMGGGLFVVLLVGSFFVTKIMRSAATTRLRRHPEVAAMRESSTTDPTLGAPTLGAPTLSRARHPWVQWEARQPVPEPLRPFLMAQQTSTLVGQAMLEGSAVVNLVFALIDGSWLHFVFVFFAVVALISMIPTVDKLRNRIENAIALD